MKKDFIFAPILLVVVVLLFLLNWTGIYAHVAISAVGVVALIVYSVLTKKEWKIPALEIAMRLFYGIALITGIIVWNVSGLLALAVIHKICGALFVFLLAVLFVHKLIKEEKA
ncbi:MAG: hypothetical protein J6Q69_05910 [Clostridia bacterium]|nr:hypothetical protein [Clostridia bacterium]